SFVLGFIGFLLCVLKQLPAKTVSGSVPGWPSASWCDMTKLVFACGGPVCKAKERMPLGRQNEPVSGNFCAHCKFCVLPVEVERQCPRRPVAILQGCLHALKPERVPQTLRDLGAWWRWNGLGNLGSIPPGMGHGSLKGRSTKPLRGAGRTPLQPAQKDWTDESASPDTHPSQPAGTAPRPLSWHAPSWR